MEVYNRRADPQAVRLRQPSQQHSQLCHGKQRDLGDNLIFFFFLRNFPQNPNRQMADDLELRSKPKR